jgi:hypothetical protein
MDLQSSHGILDELGSPRPDLEDLGLLKNYEESEDSPLFSNIQRDPLEFSVLELANMNKKE